ncbi:cation:proton antiporter [Marinobacterium arenosum]|uniref:cation:proton antiporter n=1 Tax=Marinobacterium arenosum TaxID=2862496 RepID=UPI001C963833|nr:sodium:proton antiporter [Marinobacterium arenosum]MBY4677886.1 sodium:proton antiporter [Marinobacterium arenosum]
MAIPELMLMFLGMLLLAVLLQPLARRMHLPYGLLLVFGGYIGSEILVAAGLDTGLRWYHFHDLVFFVFLPLLIFESALHMDSRQLLRNIVAILLLSTPMMLLAAGVSAVVLYYGIGYPSYFSWVVALLSGAILSATDPVAVLELFRRAGVSERLILLVDGESLFNDATAIVLFTLLTSLALMPQQEITLAAASLKFTTIFCGGILVGLMVALLLGLIYRWMDSTFNRMAVMLVAAYGSYLLAELWHLSGVVAVLVVGLIFAELQRREGDSPQRQELHCLWAFGGSLANAAIFLLLGVTITLAMFQDQWLAMLLGIAAVLLARGLGLLVTMPLVNLLPGESVGWRAQLVIYWGGIRGSVTAALALSLPLELESWYTVQSIAYGVVLFTLCVQAPTMPWLIGRLGLNRTNTDQEKS